MNSVQNFNGAVGAESLIDPPVGHFPNEGLLINVDNLNAGFASIEEIRNMSDGPTLILYFVLITIFLIGMLLSKE